MLSGNPQCIGFVSIVECEKLWGGGGGQAYHFEKKDFELGVGEEDQGTSRHFEVSFGSIRAILPM